MRFMVAGLWCGAWVAVGITSESLVQGVGGQPRAGGTGGLPPGSGVGGEESGFPDSEDRAAAELVMRPGER